MLGDIERRLSFSKRSLSKLLTREADQAQDFEQPPLSQEEPSVIEEEKSVAVEEEESGVEPKSYLTSFSTDYVVSEPEQVQLPPILKTAEGATQRPFRTDLGVPRYVRFRKRPIDSNDMTQIAWIPTLDEEVEQEDNLEENAIGMIGQIERMLFVEPEKDFREFLRNSMGWVDRYKEEREDIVIDTSENESHMEMLAANQRAFQMMMEGFEQIQNIIQAHDQLTVEKDANAEIVQTTQDNLIKDRKEVVESHFNNIEQILSTLDDVKGLKEMREKVELLKEIRAVEEADHESLINFLNGVIKTKDEQFKQTVEKQRMSLMLLEKRMLEQYKFLESELAVRGRNIEKLLEKELKEFHEKQNAEWHAAAEKLAERDKELRERIQNHRSSLIDEKAANETLEAESMTKQKIALIDKEVELQKLLEHLRAKCSAFHQVLEQEVAAFNKADDSQKTAIRTNKRAIVSIYSQLLKNKEELQNAKFKNLKAFHDKLNHYNQWCRKVEKFQERCMNIFNLTASEYFQIWLANEEEAQSMIRKLFEVDRLICEWQLGITYKDPGSAILENRGPPLTKREQAALTPYWKKRLMFVLTMPKQPQEGDGDQMSATDESDLEDVDIDTKIIQEVFDNVSKELGFFVDERLMKILQEMPDEATARLIKIDKILGCLGLTSDEDIRRFVTFFIDETGKEDTGEKLSEALDGSSIMIDLSEDIQGYDKELAHAMEDQEGEIKVVPLTKFLARFREFLACQMSPATAEMQKERARAARALARWNERDISKDSAYWDLVGNVISKDKIKLWERVLSDLEQYHAILKKRDENLKKWQQRKLFYQELRHLLSNYVSSDENKKLVVPPHVMAKLDQLAPTNYVLQQSGIEPCDHKPKTEYLN